MRLKYLTCGIKNRSPAFNVAYFQRYAGSFDLGRAKNNCDFLLSRKALIEIGIDKLLHVRYNTIIAKFQVQRRKRKARNNCWCNLSCRSIEYEDRHFRNTFWRPMH